MQGSAAKVADRGQARPAAEEGLCKGDVVLLQAGDYVPADFELLEAKGLEVDEWELTGELRPSAKQLGEGAVFVYRGSRVTRGSGKGVVVTTGADTEYGEILKQPWEQVKQKRPPLIRGRYGLLVLLLLPPFIDGVRRYDQDALVVPLFLAAAAAMVLLQNSGLFRYALTSREAKRLQARGIEVRDATCLDVVSHVDVVCLDKTGVLTTLEIKVESIHFAGDLHGTGGPLPDGEGGTLAGIGCALCNDVFFMERQHQADPIDRALIAFALEQGFDIEQLAGEYKRVYDKPFDSDDRYMAAGFELGDQRLCFAKGDPEVVLRMCSGYMTAPGGVRKVGGEFLRWARSATETANQEGDIAIALAYSQGGPMPPRRYTFLCLVRLHNPVRAGARDAVRKLEGMGIRPIMLTGDRPEAAMAVARQVGIGRGSTYCLTGKEIARMALQEVSQQAGHVAVFSRLLPSQKGVLVRLLQQRGHTVAMIGDGPNDTVALRAADVGLAFGESSSPFARRVSRMLIHDPADFLTIVASARRMERRLKLLLVLRIVALASMPAGLYWWMLR